MRMTRLGQFFRDVSSAVTRSPEVRAAVHQAGAQVGKQLEKEALKFVDRFETRRAQRPQVVTPEQRAGNEDFVRGLYRDLLQREPDAGGLAAHLAGLEGGMSRAQIRQVFLDSSEYAQLQLPRPVEPAPTPAPAPAPAPRTYPEPGPALSSVPPKAEYLDVPIDTSSADAALLSTARWVRANRPGYFDKGEDRAVAKEMMTEVIGILRAHGFDAHRVVNHPSLPPSNPVRWGSDSVVLNGKIHDLFVAWGEPGRADPTLGYMGPYAAGRLRE
jgi:Domain of unknown function (DUF4214)